MSKEILQELIDILYENKEQDYIFNLISNGIFKILEINRNYIFTNDILLDYVIKNINMIYINEEGKQNNLFDLVCDMGNSIFYPEYCAFLLDNGISIDNIRAFLSKWDLCNMIIKIMMFIDKKIDIKLIYKNPSIWKYINECFNCEVKPKLKYCAFLIEKCATFLIEKCATFLIEKCATNLINEHETNLINEHETNEHKKNKKIETQIEAYTISRLIKNELYSIIKLLLDNGFIFKYHMDILCQQRDIDIRNLKQYKFIIENNLINKRDLINIIKWNYFNYNMRPIEYSLAKHLIFKEHIDIIFTNQLIFRNCDYINENNIYKIKVLIKLKTNYLKQLYI